MYFRIGHREFRQPPPSPLRDNVSMFIKRFKESSDPDIEGIPRAESPFLVRVQFGCNCSDTLWKL